MLPFERYTIEVDGHKLHVMEQGSGRPVLLLHGNPTWGFLYRKVAAELRNAGVRLVMPDLIGLGLSDKPRDPNAHTLRAQILHRRNEPRRAKRIRPITRRLS